MPFHWKRREISLCNNPIPKGFQKAKTAQAEAARAISAFWKIHLCISIQNWTRQNEWLPILNSAFGLGKIYLLMLLAVLVIKSCEPLPFHLNLAWARDSIENQDLISN